MILSHGPPDAMTALARCEAATRHPPALQALARVRLTTSALAKSARRRTLVFSDYRRVFDTLRL
jgi:hypothetical protein